ncbi:inositol 2-dehydrogenase [Paenibacillus gansuensis]|uniref:Inositol 2-dehydrogenase n=1 Tax=Paenibacillus gansuensis TaxID=306542 RepID=A0ABW5P7Y9_9BACL
MKAGVIGAGRIGKIHIDNLLRMPQVEVHAVSDLYADEALEQWANERGIPVVTRNSSDVMNDTEIDVVFICSSTDTHVPLILEAAKAGKHIFCEKPVSMDITQTIKAIEAVKEAGIKLQIGFNRRFDHNFKYVRDTVQAGKIGDPHIIKITSRDPNPPHEDYIQVSGGIFMDMMIHDFDMARFLAGCNIEEVYAQGNVLIDPVFAAYGDIDTAISTLRFENGAIGVIDNSRKAVYGYDQRVEVFGSGGSVTVANDFPNTAEISNAEGIYREKPLNFFLERYQEAYLVETKQFIECIDKGLDIPVSGSDALQAELAALAAKWSYTQKRPVKISEVLEQLSITK